MADQMGFNANAVSLQLQPGSHPMPANYEHVEALDDTDNHDLIIDARGKGRASFAIENETNRTVTLAIYGAHHSDDEIDGGTNDVNVHQIGSTVTVLTAAKDYDTWNDPFPFYILRLTAAVAPNGANVTLNVTLQAQ